MSNNENEKKPLLGETEYYYLAPNCRRPLKELHLIDDNGENTPTGFDHSLLRKINKALDRTRTDLYEVWRKIKPPQRELIYIVDPKTKNLITLNQWFEPFLEKNGAELPNERKELSVSYPKHLSALRNKNGTFYLELPIEVQIVLSMAGSIVAETPEEFALVMNEYLDIYRESPALAIAGMSVGGEIFKALIERFPLWLLVRIADPQEWHRTVKNKAPYPPEVEGRNKCELREQEAFDRAPWVHVHSFPEGVTTTNVGEFLKGLTLAVEAMDDIYMKYVYRKKARELGIPILMFSDVHPNIVVEYRPFHLDQSLPLFVNISDEEVEKRLMEVQNAEDEEKPMLWVTLAADMIGRQNVPEKYLRHAEAFAEGKIGILAQPTELIKKAGRVSAEVVDKFLSNEDIPEIQVF